MPNDLELTLSHDGYCWSTDGFNTKLYGQDLDSLENKITLAIDNDPRFANNKSVNIHLRFNLDVLPPWLHQYQFHYFNYSFKVYKKELK